MKLLLAFAGLALAAAFEPITIKMDRIENRRERMIRLGLWSEEEQFRAEARLIRKFRDVLGIDEVEGGVNSQPLTNVNDASYAGGVNAGTNNPTFRMIMDTGSSNTWFTGKGCGGGGSCTGTCNPQNFICHFFCNRESTCCPNKLAEVSPVFAGDPCQGKNKFDCSKSPTCKMSNTPFSIRYGTGSCSGKLASDNVCLVGPGGAKSICVKQHTFGVANQLAAFFAGQKMDGIMGLGWRQIAVDHVEPFVNQYFDQNPSVPKMFTVWLSNKQGLGGGLITYGALDSTHCDTSKIFWTNLVAETYWIFNMQAIQLGSFSDANQVRVISDTGTSLLAGPQNDIAQMANAIGASYNAGYGLYTLACGDYSGKDIVVNIAGHMLHVTAHSYNVQLAPGLCFFGAQGFDGGATLSWILGDTFIRSFCNVYDVKNMRIGFMPNKDLSGN